MAEVHDLDIEYVSETSVCLSWRLEHNGAVLSCVSRVFMRPEDGEFSLIGEVKEDNEFELSALVPLRAYDVYVQCVGVVAGDGPQSDMLSFRMLPLPLSSAPEALQVSLRGGSVSEAEVSWQACATDEETEGSLEGYILFYDQETTEEYVELELDASRTSYIVRGLAPNTIYRFQVAGLNVAGEGPMTDIVAYTTPISAFDLTSSHSHSQSSSSSSSSSATTSTVGGTTPTVSGATLSRKPKQVSQADRSPRLAAKISKVPHDAAPAVAPSSPWGPRKAIPKLDTGILSTPSSSTAQNNSDNNGGYAEGKRKTPSPRGSPYAGRHAPPPLAGACYNASSTALRRSGTLAPPPGATAAAGPAGDAGIDGKTGVASVAEADNSAGPVHERKRDTQVQADALARELDTVAVLAAEKAEQEGSSSTGGKVKFVVSERPGGAGNSGGHGGNFGLRGGQRDKTKRKTIRGKAGGVRRAKEMLMRDAVVQSISAVSRYYEAEKDGKIVIYTTSVSVVRGTHVRCQDVLKVFSNMRLRTERRDISLDDTYAKEFAERCPGADTPQVFVNGLHFGDHEKILSLNETGELKGLLSGFEERADDDCPSCGGVGFITCRWCRGTKKSFQHKFEKHDRGRMALRCTACNVNGLQRCPKC